MGDLDGFEIGQTVELSDGRIATVRFVGNTHFAPGDWIGVELQDSSGKNDGAVQGQRYFDCTANYGMFVRPNVAVVIEQSTPKPPKRLSTVVNGVAARRRPSSVVVGGTKRQNVMDPISKRNSNNIDTPTPAPRTPALRNIPSPTKSPTKQRHAKTNSTIVTSRNPSAAAGVRSTKTAANRTSISVRPPVAPTTNTAAMRAQRPSVAATLSGSPRPGSLSTNKPGNRLSMLQRNGDSRTSISGSSQASARSGQESPIGSPDMEAFSPAEDDGPELSTPLALPSSRQRAATASRAVISPRALSKGQPSPAPSQRSPMANTAQSREIEDLNTKLRVMSNKRLEDREKLKDLERIRGERDRFEGIIQKLQSKYQPQHQEIADLRKQIKLAEAKAEEAEAQQADIDTAVEMAALDREMAEEMADSLKAELENLRQKHEELELEVEILREENADLGREITPEEKSSQGYAQLEKSNERLREALLRLRDLTQEAEAELKGQIQELESDVQELAVFRSRYEETKEKLNYADSLAEDLKQQLETALGAEEMIEELTEKNMALTQEIEELKSAVEDLETLKEINDELELNHIENERQMQDDMDYKDAQLLEQLRKSSTQDEVIEDLEYTVSKFRELVTTLQSDLEEMRISQQISEAEASDLSGRAKAMLDMNMRLQISAAKAQVKAIDTELRRLDSQESADHLAIVQVFLPDSYSISRSSVDAFLRFKRVGFKSTLLHGLVKERVNGVAVPGNEDGVFASCDILDKLTWVSAMCTRFTKFTMCCSLESFDKLGTALYDLEPLERALNGWINGMKRDELKEHECSSDLQRSIAVMTHLAEVHMVEGLHDYAEDVYMRALVMQSNLDTSASAVSHIKAIAQAKILLPADAREEDEEEAQEFLQEADDLTSQIRSAKVIAGKAINQIEELQTRALTLAPSTASTIEQSLSVTSELASACRASGLSVCNTINEEGRTSFFTYSELTTAISASDSTPFHSLNSKVQTAMSQIQAFYTLTTTLSQTTEFTPPSASPPWQLLARKLRAETTTSATYEKEIHRLRDELAQRNTALMMKDKTLSEMSVSVEVLSKRVQDSSRHSVKLRELETQLETAHAKEQSLVQKVGSLESDLQTVQAEHAALRARAPDSTDEGAVPGGGKPNHSPSNSAHNFVPARAQADIDALRAELAILRSTIRQLRLAAHVEVATYSFPSSSPSLAFLAKPLLRHDGASSERRHETQKQILHSHEAKDVLRALRTLVTSGESEIVPLVRRQKEERLAWRPVRETPGWLARRQRGDLESWKEWGEGVMRRAKESGGGAGGSGSRRTDTRRDGDAQVQRGTTAQGKARPLARLMFTRMGGDVGAGDGKEEYCGPQEVTVVDPSQWESLQGRLGLAV